MYLWNRFPSRRGSIFFCSDFISFHRWQIYLFAARMKSDVLKIGLKLIFSCFGWKLGDKKNQMFNLCAKGKKRISCWLNNANFFVFKILSRDLEFKLKIVTNNFAILSKKSEFSWKRGRLFWNYRNINK